MARLGDLEGMTWKTLEEVCAINPKTKQFPDDMEVSFVPMQRVSDTGDVQTDEIRKVSEVKKGFTFFEEGDVLFAKITPCMENGKGGIARNLKNGIGFGSTEFHVMHPDLEKVSSEWLYYLTSWDEFREQCARNMTGSAGQKRVPKSYLEHYKVHLPSLEEQRRIVILLDKVKDLIAKRRAQLDKLDLLVKSRFVEMFGDRWANNMSWPQEPLQKCATFYNGKAHEQVVDDNGEYILVTSRCIASNQQEVRRTNAMLFPLRHGDICMVMSDVPNGKALAKCMMIEQDGQYTLNQRICCLRDYDLNPTFFLYTLNRNEYFLSFDDGDSQTNLRKNDLLACPIIIPPLELQDQFAVFVEKVEKLKLMIQQSLDKLETLKKSLMQHYFG